MTNRFDSGGDQNETSSPVYESNRPSDAQNGCPYPLPHCVTVWD